MNGQKGIRLTNVNVAGQQDIELLIEAANDIQSATEANFMRMKEKKWYKRLWEIATFSKDNIKVVAKNTASLAQIQDIILRVILMASKESKELSRYLATNSEQLENMAKGYAEWANAIAKIKYGHDTRPDINDMPTEYQYVIVSTALKFADKVCSEQGVSHSVQQYLRNLRNSCEAGLNPEVANFDYAKINNLKADGHKLLAFILCEVDVLLDDTLKKAIAFDEVARHIGISSIMLDEIKSRAAKYAQMMGKEFIASYYDRNVVSDDVLTGNDYEWVESLENDAPKKLVSESNEGDFALPPDDTEAQFLGLRETVLKYVPEMKTNKRNIRKGKSIKAFIDEHSLKVVNEAVIALIDTSIVGDGEVGIMFTTHAIYQKERFENLVKIPYSDIDYDKCKLTAHKKGKPTKLKIEIVNKDPITLSYSSDIKLDVFLDMLIKIGKLPEYALADSPQPIAEMDYSVKFPFAKYIVNFMKYIKRPTIEVMRFACNIGFTDDQLSELAQYIAVSKESDMNILLQINNNAPYGSRKSLKYTLIIEMYSQLQFVKGSLDVSLLEHEFIRKTAELYGFSKDDIANLKVVAETKYKIITGQIKSVKELHSVEKALTGLALAGGIPLATVIGSSFLFWNTWWFWFIPGIGTVIGTALAGIAIAVQIINKNKNDAEFSKQRRDMFANEIASYVAAIDRLLLLFPGMAEIKLLQKTLLSKYGWRSK